MMKNVYWTVSIVLNSARVIAVLAILERMSGYCLDWPNGSDGWPVLVRLADFD